MREKTLSRQMGRHPLWTSRLNFQLLALHIGSATPSRRRPQIEDPAPRSSAWPILVSWLVIVALLAVAGVEAWHLLEVNLSWR